MVWSRRDGVAARLARVTGNDRVRLCHADWMQATEHSACLVVGERPLGGTPVQRGVRGGVDGYGYVLRRPPGSPGRARSRNAGWAAPTASTWTGFCSRASTTCSLPSASTPITTDRGGHTRRRGRTRPNGCIRLPQGPVGAFYAGTSSAASFANTPGRNGVAWISAHTGYAGCADGHIWLTTPEAILLVVVVRLLRRGCLGHHRSHDDTANASCHSIRYSNRLMLWP